MSYYLISKHREMSLTIFDWQILRELADNYGWEPLGTKAPYDWDERSEGRTWCGTYASNDSQEVTAEDASNMANALCKAIKDIRTGERDGELIEFFFEEEINDPNRNSTPPDGTKFREGVIRRCEKFIEFCKGAPFLIE